MKVVSIIGGRPQFIKAAPVSQALAAEGIEEVLVDTGQHYDSEMAAVFVRELGLQPPRHCLSVGSGLHGQMTGRMLERAEQVLCGERPDVVVVYGDTNSTLGGALAAAKLRIPVAHVEAGLRSYVFSMAEEINRRIVDHLSSVLFCPTATAVENLKKEGIGSPTASTARLSLSEAGYVDVSLRPLVVNVGDVILDIAERERSSLEQTPVLPGAERGRYALVTVHRAEATDDIGSLKGIVDSLVDLARAIPVIFPVHPRTRAALETHGLFQRLAGAAGMQCVAPLSYRTFSRAMRDARIVITDSGGVQKEAFILGVPCLTLRDETEWPETMEGGWNKLIGRRPAGLTDAALAAPDPARKPMEAFGDGKAAVRIAKIIRRFQIR